MESLQQSIPGIVVFNDDILITGYNEEDHVKSLEQVFKGLFRVGLRAKWKKCEFMHPAVVFLGHRIDKNGLHGSTTTRPAGAEVLLGTTMVNSY